MRIKNSCHLMHFVLLQCLSLKVNLSFGAHVIFANQSLAGRETIVSKEGNFGLGFFCPGTSTTNLGKYYLGIWYTKVSVPTVVWVANRESPLSDIYSSELKIQDGNLVILNGSQTVIWSTNINYKNSSSLMAILLDDGNLKVIDGFSDLNSDPPLWQSFDNPTDTWLPGSKLSYSKITKRKQILTSWRSTEDPAPGMFSLELVPSGKECVIRWNRTKQFWTTGTWNGLAFSLVPEMRNYSYNYSYIDNTNESYVTYSINNPAVLSRIVIAISGQFMLLTWSGDTKEWNTLLAQPRKECEIYAYCGAFGICNENSLPSCVCSPGFEYPSDRHWHFNNTSGDCVRKTMLQCENNISTKGKKDKFWKENRMRLPEDYEFWAVASAAECKSACLSDCTCTAYAYNDGNNCSIWKGKLFNLKKLSGGEGTGGTICIRISASDFSREENNGQSWIDLPGSSQEGRKHVNKLIISIIVVGAALLASSFSLIFFRRRILAKRKGSMESILRNEMTDLADKARQAKDLLLEDNHIDDVPFFSLEKIMTATDNFSDANKLGQGGFGPVYKGTLPGGKEIAVKRLSSPSGQGIEEFQNEVRLIAKLQHRNLVRLLGYCVEGSEKILVYEYMPNKSLDTLIFDQGRCILLDWGKRFNIISGIARGLLYLHEDSRLRVVHRDLKTSNILLDEGLNPKIADFGMARILGGKEMEAHTRKVAGTFGYMSPEYAVEGLFSVKSDVFSFGVILLEILCGKRNTGYHEESMSLLAYVWRLWEEGKAIELIDVKLMESDSTGTSEVLKSIHIGLLCVQGSPFERPTMADVVIMLGNEIESLPNPNEPAFVVRKRPASSSPEPDMNSINGLTASVEEGR